MEFASLEMAQAWYNSPEYRAIAPLREQSTKSRAILVEGVGEVKVKRQNYKL